jgi:hypothetical protein
VQQKEFSQSRVYKTYGKFNFYLNLCLFDLSASNIDNVAKITYRMFM